MKIRHIKGVKVCTVKDELNDLIYVYDYKNIVRALNKIFREAELTEYLQPNTGYNPASAFLSDRRTHYDPMKVVLTMLMDICGVEAVKCKPGDIVYDDEKIVQKTKEPKLKLPRFTNEAGEYRGLKVITGGTSTV